MQITGEGRVTLPLPLKTGKALVKLNGTPVKSQVAGGKLVLDIDRTLSGQWLEVVEN